MGKWVAGYELSMCDGDHGDPREGPEKVVSFFSKTPTLITETEQK